MSLFRSYVNISVFIYIVSKLRKCLDTVQHVMKDAKMKQSDIDDVVLVGGRSALAIFL